MAAGARLSATESRRDSAEVGPVSALPDLYVKVLSVTIPSQADLVKDGTLVPSAQVRLYRFDPETGTFFKKATQVKQGEAVGSVVKQRNKDVDFSTGAVLEEVKQITRRDEKLGRDMPVQVIVLKYPDGYTEELDDKMVYPKLKE